LKTKTKKIKTIFGALTLAVLLFSGCSYRQDGEEVDEKTNETNETIEQSAQVLHIFDGDTFSVRIDGKVETVRALGIDAPESGAKYTIKECYSAEATKRAVELLGGQEVKLAADPTQADRDKYQRLLRYVYLSDGRFFNKIMIKEGFAREYTFENKAYQFQAEFRESQTIAQQNRFGLWGECEKNTD
jgi:micrococcal nuclease